MATIHNYGVRHRYGTPGRDVGAGSGRGTERSGGSDHWSSDDPVDEERPERGPAGPDKAGGGRKKDFPGMPGGRKLE